MPPLNTIKISQLLVRNCRPIVIAVQDATKGNRLGGNPPTGVVPLIVKPWTCYFATLEITDDPPDPPMELSVFLAGGSSVDLLRQCMHLMPANEGPVQLVIHPASARAAQSEFHSDLSGHSLLIQEEIEDLHRDEGAPDHKLGGRPFYHHDYRFSILEETQRALASGYFHYLQLSFPGYGDAPVTGTWPFGEYVFHIFARESPEGFDFLCGWA